MESRAGGGPDFNATPRTRAEPGLTVTPKGLLSACGTFVYPPHLHGCLGIAVVPRALAGAGRPRPCDTGELLALLAFWRTCQWHDEAATARAWPVGGKTEHVDNSLPPSSDGTVSGEHPVDRFFTWLDAVPPEAYPPDLVPVAGRHMRGVAAFPAGRGLYAPCGWDHEVPPRFPFGGLMLVGNHLDAEDVYVQRLVRGEANGDPCPGARRMRFWSMLYALLDLADIRRADIFVTNVHPALFKGSQATGVIAPSDAWKRLCADLLLSQVRVMRPWVIAAMGAPAQRFLGGMFNVDWHQTPSYVLSEVEGRPTALAAIRHPSAAQSHEGRRQTAEVLQEALSHDRQVGRPPHGEG